MRVDGVVMMMLCLRAESSRSGPLGQRRRQKLIARQEQHRELRTVLELLPVTLLAEFAHALFHLLCVTREARCGALRRPALRWRPCRRRAASWRRPRCCAPRACAPAGRGAMHRPRAMSTCVLLGEIAVFGHAGELDHATQREFAPAAAHFRASQRRGRDCASRAAGAPGTFTRFRSAGEHAPTDSRRSRSSA